MQALARAGGEAIPPANGNQCLPTVDEDSELQVPAWLLDLSAFQRLSLTSGLGAWT